MGIRQKMEHRNGNNTEYQYCTLMVHNLARLEELRGELQDTAEKIAEQVYETDEDFQRYVPNELNKAATCLQNISNVLAAHTTGHGYISSEVCQKSKDTLLTTREEASCLPGPTARVEVSYYNTRSTCRKENLPLVNPCLSSSTKQNITSFSMFRKMWSQHASHTFLTQPNTRMVR